MSPGLPGEEDPSHYLRSRLRSVSEVSRPGLEVLVTTMQSIHQVLVLMDLECLL